MQYLKTLNVWDKSIHRAIVSGQIKLQSGQWLTCGTKSEHKSRFVSLGNGGTINAVHWQGSGKATNRKFKMAVEANRKQQERMKCKM